MNARRFMILMAVVVGFVSTNAWADIFTGAVDDNWHVPNNWMSGNVPDGNGENYIGSPWYSNVTARIYSGLNGLGEATHVGGGASVGSLVIEAGATLSAAGEFGVGTYDSHFDANYMPGPVDANQWVVGGTGTLTVNGTITLPNSNLGFGAALRGTNSHGTIYLNAGGLIEQTGSGNDVYLGMDYYYDWGGHYEFYHADGGTLKIADDFHMNAGPNSPNAFYKMSGGTLLTGQDNTGLGYGRVYNGTFWVDGGTATIVPGGTTSADWSFFGFVTYAWPGDDANSANNQPVLKLSGTNPLLKVNGLLSFAAARLDVNHCQVRIPGWQWVTVAEANEIGDFTDYQHSVEGDGNDLVFAPSVDTNIWSMRIVDNKVQVKLSLRGDMDGSGKVDSDDINPFVLAIVDPNAYIAIYGVDPYPRADLDFSGKIDSDDIHVFVKLLVTPCGLSIPEPACLALLCLGALAVVRRRRIIRLNR